MQPIDACIRAVDGHRKTEIGLTGVLVSRLERNASARDDSGRGADGHYYWAPPLVMCTVARHSATNVRARSIETSTTATSVCTCAWCGEETSLGRATSSQSQVYRCAHRWRGAPRKDDMSARFKFKTRCKVHLFDLLTPTISTKFLYRHSGYESSSL